MSGIGLGAAAFFVLFWVDFVSLKGMSIVKPVLWLGSATLFIVGLADTVRNPPQVLLPAALPVFGWVLVGIFSLLLVYSLFVEIPFVSAYVQRGCSARGIFLDKSPVF